MLQPSYKSLQRQLRRLPLPTNAIKDGSAVLKHRYKLGKTKIFETIFTQILQYEKYHKSIPLLLDAIYKDSKPKWYRDFINIPYMQVKKDWPTMHIIDELTKDTKTISMYHEKLQSPFRLVDHVKGKDKVKKNAFPIFTKYSDQTSSVPRLINDVEKAYKFLMNESIFNLTKHPFEVIHLPTKMGTPEHPVGLDTNLRDTVTLVKSALEKNQPIRKDQFTKLMTSYTSGINPNFQKQLLKKRQENTTSVQVRKLINRESVLANDFFERIYLAYIKQQYYLVDNQYKLALNHSTFKIT